MTARTVITPCSTLIYKSNLCLNIPESAEPGKNAGCFPADATVRLSSGKRIPMSELRIGDKVQAVGSSSGELEYSEVLLFLDRSQDEVRTFLNLRTESGSVLTVTSSHLVQASSSSSCLEPTSCFQASYAGSVEPGHYILVSGDGALRPERVVEVSVRRLKGVYAPLTRSGTLVVDNVLASSYAVIDSQFIAHAAFAPVRWASAFKANLRLLWKSVSFSSSEPRTMRYSPPEGVHWYARLLYSIAGYILPDHLVLGS